MNKTPILIDPVEIIFETSILNDRSILSFLYKYFLSTDNKLTVNNFIAKLFDQKSINLNSFLNFWSDNYLYIPQESIEEYINKFNNYLIYQKKFPTSVRRGKIETNYYDIIVSFNALSRKKNFSRYCKFQKEVELLVNTNSVINLPTLFYSSLAKLLYGYKAYVTPQQIIELAQSLNLNLNAVSIELARTGFFLPRQPHQYYCVSRRILYCLKNQQPATVPSANKYSDC